MESVSLINEKKVKYLTRIFIFLMLIFDFANSLFAPIFILYSNTKGLNTFQFNVILAIIMFSIFIFEIPTGVFSDVFGRKRSFIMSMVCMGIAKLVFLMSSNMLGFVIGALIDGLAFALFSGSIEAWIVDEVEKLGVKDFEGIFAKSGRASEIGMIAGGFIGGYLVKGSYNLVWIISAFLLFMLAAAAFILVKEENKLDEKQSLGVKEGIVRMKETVITSIKVLRDNKLLAFLILIGCYEMLLVGGTAHLWQKYLPEKLNLVQVVSWVWIILSVGRMIGNSILAKIKIKPEWKLNTIMSSYIFIAALFLLSGILKNGYLVILVIFLRNIITGIKGPLFGSLINENIENQYRSTILSFSSQSRSIFQNIGLLSMGWVAQTYGVAFSWVTTGVLILGIYLIWGIVRPKAAVKMKVDTANVSD